MRVYLAASGFILLIGMMVSCASQPLPQPEWIFEESAIHLHLKADEKLNFYEERPHTLVLCAYQLKDPNVFNQLSGDINGIYQLLECGLFDNSVATSKRFILHPDQDLKVQLDRAQDAQYLAVVAGYSDLDKDRMIRLFKVPVVIEKKGWFFNKKQLTKPGLLKLKLHLGAQQIRETKDS